MTYTNGQARANATMQHHLSDQYGGYSMVLRQLIWFHDHKWDQFWFRLADQQSQTFDFGHLQSNKYWHGLTPMGKQEPMPQCNITYQTHMEDIQWSGGN
jgi:hypothetical protein